VARESHFEVYVAVPSVSGQQVFLDGLGVFGGERRNWEDLSLKAKGTPTIIVVNPKRIVEAVWIGQLTAKTEASILAHLRGLDKAAGAGKHAQVTSARSTDILRNLPSGSSIDGQELRALTAVESYVILDVRERPEFQTGHLESAINMPFSEVAFRAPQELRQSELHIVDCGSIIETRCSEAATRLAEAGVSRTLVLNPGTYFEVCPGRRGKID
jgi:rhodanese-related sulfurtransferase